MKITGLIFILFILSINVAKAQQSNQFYIDSLKHQLTIAREDSNKVDILAALGNYYGQSSADTGVAYAQQALDLATKINYQFGILQSEGVLSIALTISGNYPLGLDYAFKTLSLAKKSYPERIGWARSLVAYCYYYLGEYKTFLEYTLGSLKAVQPWELSFGWRDLALGYNSLH